MRGRDGDEKRAVEDRLGPDPIRDPGPGAGCARRVRRRGAALAQPRRAAPHEPGRRRGRGEHLRAEALFRAGLDPMRSRSRRARGGPAALWDDLVVLMHDGARTGAIVTTRPEHRDDGAGEGPDEAATGRRRVRQNTDVAPGAVPADEAFYVYHRDGLPCRVCGTPVLLKELAGRNLFWCGVCQT
nr:zinc finger domain-containing protein [Cellulosimicrobium sp. MM]